MNIRMLNRAILAIFFFIKNTKFKYQHNRILVSLTHIFQFLLKLQLTKLYMQFNFFKQRSHIY